MGTVRREGDWRLEKRQEGVYEITFRKEPQMKIYTSDASPNGGEPLFNSVPVREVSSYGQAERLFEEKARGPAPFGMEYSSSQSSFGWEDTDLSDLPPGGLGAVFLFSGSFIVYIFWGADNGIALLMGVAFAGVGVAILSYGAYLVKNEGWQEAYDYLLTEDENGTSSSSSNDDQSQEKTPPASQSLKDELFFERADRSCEYCENEIDQPEVHHIKPRSEGGPNDPDNLIVLCPNCHRKADSGAISRSKLNYRVNKQMKSSGI